VDNGSVAGAEPALAAQSDHPRRGPGVIAPRRNRTSGDEPSRLVVGEYVGCGLDGRRQPCEAVTAVLSAAPHNVHMQVATTIRGRMTRAVMPPSRRSRRTGRAGCWRRGRVHASIWPVTVGFAVAAAVAACGSTGKSSTSARLSGSSQAVRFANCMRSHGVSDFPDPSASGAFPQDFPPSKLTRSPAYQSAQHACRSLTPNGFDAPTHLSESQLRAALRFAQCIRAHGWPKFPDLTLNPPRTGGPGIMYITPGGRGPAYVVPPGIDARSAAFHHAARGCGVRPLLGIGSG
jgi:hypothetical protein